MSVTVKVSSYVHQKKHSCVSVESADKLFEECFKYFKRCFTATVLLFSYQHIFKSFCLSDKTVPLFFLPHVTEIKNCHLHTHIMMEG